MKQYLPFVIGILGMVLVGVGVIIPKLRTPEPEITVVKDDSGPGRNDASETKTITVDVEGAVEKPGVYQLPADSRIADALIPAGGLGANADRNAIAKSINMAQKLTDGTKIYFPFLSDQTSANLSNNSNLTDINVATLEELDKLPGVGPVTAQKIVDNRPYQNVSDLLTKKILSSSLYTKLKDKLSVY